MIRLIMFFSLLLVGNTAQAWTLGTLDYMSLDVARFGDNREPMTPQIGSRDYLGRVRANFNLALFDDLIKWKNEVHTEGTREKVETVGWHYTVSIPTPWGFEPYYEHHSRHVMDMDQPIIAGTEKPVRFAVEDSYGIRIIFYNRDKK